MKRVKAACICQTLHFMLKEDLAHDCIQFVGAKLGCAAGLSSPLAVHFALPDLLFSLGAFQHLSVEAYLMLLAEDF